MNRFKSNTRGTLSSDDLDTLVRWGLRSSVQDVQPSDAVWQRIQAQAGARKPAPQRGAAPAQMMRRLATVPAGGLGTVGGSLMAVVRFIGSIIEAYDEHWPEANRARWAFTPGFMWIMLATEGRIY
jgi:hypothetical protein